MSKITNDGLTWTGTRCFPMGPYGNSGHQRVKAEVARCFYCIRCVHVRPYERLLRHL